MYTAPSYLVATTVLTGMGKEVELYIIGLVLCPIMKFLENMGHRCPG
jgi:hypothetical protein